MRKVLGASARRRIARYYGASARLGVKINTCESDSPVPWMVEDFLGCKGKHVNKTLRPEAHLPAARFEVVSCPEFVRFCVFRFLLFVVVFEI